MQPEFQFVAGVDPGPPISDVDSSRVRAFDADADSGKRPGDSPPPLGSGPTSRRQGEEPYSGL